MGKTVSLIMPVYNESARLKDALIPVLKSKKFHEIIVVDDGSTDDTGKILHQLAKKYQFKIHTQDNGGKGSAIRAGITNATGSHVAILDADGEYDYNDVFRAANLANGVAVFGSRFINNPRLPKGMRIRNAVANLALSWLVNKLAHTNLTDVMTCIKVFPNNKISLSDSSFAIECEIAVKLAKNNVQIVEIPIGYVGRTVEQGKKIKPKDFFTCVIAIVRYSIWPR
jgi:glycosyltransferase involved in cell wall biosynthesis